jgi:hypothetical protein
MYWKKMRNHKSLWVMSVDEVSYGASLQMATGADMVECFRGLGVQDLHEQEQVLSCMVCEGYPKRLNLEIVAEWYALLDQAGRDKVLETLQAKANLEDKLGTRGG